MTFQFYGKLAHTYILNETLGTSKHISQKKTKKNAPRSPIPYFLKI